MKDNHVRSLLQLKVVLKRNFNASKWICRLQINGQVVKLKVTHLEAISSHQTESKIL